MTESLPILAIIGGSGALGSGLTMRWAGKGYPIVIGSRSRDKAERVARTLKSSNAATPVRGMDNAAAAAAGDIVVITVPFASHETILAQIKDAVAGKIVIDTTVPLVPPEITRVQLPPQGSAAQITQEILGPDVQVVSAFHHVSARKLQSQVEIDCDVLVFADKPSARETVITLIAALSIRGLHGGPLANAAAAEALTSVLIGINRHYGVDAAGLRVTGLASPASAEVA